MKRFYKDASVESSDSGFHVALDGRAVKTPQATVQTVSTRRLADALAAEWRAQGETIDPTSFRFRDHADHAIDLVARNPAGTIDTLLSFAETDTLCYRANPDEALYRRQQEVWEPLVAALEAREGIGLERINGIIHRPQPQASLETLRRKLGGFDGFTLAGLEAMTSLAASLCIGLAALESDAEADMLWDAAELEEGWQADLWGRDEQAEIRRSERRENFRAAFDFVRLVRT